MISPQAGSMSPLTAFNNDDLPHPFLPVIAMRSPKPNEKFSPFKTFFSPRQMVKSFTETKRFKAVFSDDIDISGVVSMFF